MLRRFTSVLRHIKLPAMRRAIIPITLCVPYLFKQLLFYRCESDNPSTTDNEPIIETIPELEIRDSFKHKNIIIYAKTGVKNVDDTVHMLLNIYVDLFPSNNLKILTLENWPTETLPLGLTVIRRYSGDTSFIDLGYFSSQGSSIEEFYSKVIKHINKKLQEIPIFKTISEFVNTGLNPDHEIIILLKTDSNNKKHFKHRVKLEKFKKSAQIYERNTGFMIADGPQIAEQLTLKDVPDGDIVMLVPESSKNFKEGRKNKLQKVRLSGTDYLVISNIDKDETILSNFIFTPLTNNKYQYFSTVRINKNKVDPVMEQYIYKQMEKTTLPVRMMTTNQIEGWELLVNKNSDQIEELFTTSSGELTPEQTQKKIMEPREWKYGLDVLNGQLVGNWISDCMKNRAPPYYKSQPTGAYDRYSKKLSGKTFHEILQSPHDEVVFYYSEHCASCKRFGKIFETLAKNNPYKSYLRFSHINNDKNKTSTGHNFGFTPVFAYFKKECKQKPFIYKQAYFTEKAFRDFLEISHDIKIFEEDKFQKALKMRESNADPMNNNNNNN